MNPRSSSLSLRRNAGPRLFPRITRWHRPRERHVMGKRPGARRGNKQFRPTVERLERRDVPTAGALDTAFGSGGLVNLSFPSAFDNQAQAVAVQADGKI